MRETGSMNHRICKVRHEELRLDLLPYLAHIGGRVQVVLLDYPSVALRKPVLARSNESVVNARARKMLTPSTRTSSTEGLG